VSQDTILRKARQMVADKYAHDYTKRAILNGDWDSGQLIKAAVAQLQTNGSAG
jgi:hypothetical protein